MLQSDSQLPIRVPPHYRKCISGCASIIKTYYFNGVYLTTVALENPKKIPLYSATIHDAANQV